MICTLQNAEDFLDEEGREGTVCRRHGVAGLAELERVGTKGGVSGSGWVFPDSGASFLSFLSVAVL